MSDTNRYRPKIVIEVLPHPRFKGHWLVCRERLLPYAVWFERREDAFVVSDAGLRLGCDMPRRADDAASVLA